MKKNARVKEIAGNLLNWINELYVEENGMRTDAVVQVVVRELPHGNVLSRTTAFI